jgi:phosphoglycerate dehydrogenase-like enzyme
MRRDVSCGPVTEIVQKELRLAQERCNTTVSMRGGQERNVANETVEIGFVGLGHMGTTMAVSLLAAGFKVLCFVVVQSVL